MAVSDRDIEAQDADQAYADGRPPSLADLACFTGWLCVECRRCGHRCVFEAGSPPTAKPPERLLRALVCRRCGGRAPKLHRAPSPRDAQRWRLDR